MKAISLFGMIAVGAVGLIVIFGSATESKFKDSLQIDAERKQQCDNAFSKADLGNKPSNYKAIITGYLKESLKDPDSAKIDWGKQSGPTPGYGNLYVSDECNIGWTVCVPVNAKNSYGGYIGSRRMSFIIRDNSVIYANEGRELPYFYRGCN